MGSVFSAKNTKEETDLLCKQCKEAWPDKNTDADGFKREYKKFRDETSARDGKKRGNGAYKGTARMLGLLNKVRKKDAAGSSDVASMPALFIRR
jgi:hypothetical protein